MLILKRKHKEAVEKAHMMSYADGYVKGREDATQRLEGGFKYTLSQYNERSIEVRRENAKLTIENRRLKKEIESVNKDLEKKDAALKALCDLSRENESDIKYKQSELEEKERKIDILKYFLRCNYSKDVSRYENIARRTKKARIKEKAEKKIIELKELELAFK